MLLSVFGFTIATCLCGQAEALETLVLWRIPQGGIGAPVVPLANAIALDSFPRRQAGLVSSIFGMTVVLGPVIGPVFGGVLARPKLALGLLHDRPGRGACRPRAPSHLAAGPPGARVPLDWIGFLALSTAIACVQLVCRAGSGWTGRKAPRSSPRPASPRSPFTCSWRIA